MKPFQLIFIGVFAFLALLGLYFFATFSGVGGGKPIGQVTIWGILPYEEMEIQVNALRDKDRRMTDVFYVEKSMASFSNDLADALASGTGPDLVIITQEQLIDEQDKLQVIPFSAISERTFVDSYVPMAELFLTPEGPYGLPILVDPLVLYYNRAMLSSAGAVGAPATWEAVNGLAQLVTKKSDAQTITKSAIAFGEYTNVANARAIISLLLLQSGTPITSVGTRGMDVALASDTSDGPAETAMNFYTQFADPAKTVYSWNRSMNSSRDAFIAGDLALYPSLASEQPFLEAANPNLDYEMAPIPQPATLQNRVTYGVMYAIVMPKAARNPSGAAEVAFTFASPDLTAQLASALSMAPAARSALTAPRNDRYASVFYPEALVAKGWLSPAPSTVDGIFAGMIGNITSGRRNVEDSLRTADESLEAALP